MQHKNPELMKGINTYIRDFYLDHDRTPSTTEIARQFEISRSSAQRYLVAMNEKGMLSYQGGKLVGFNTVDDDCDIMMVTTGGIIIRIHVKDVSVQGRSASGVKVMNITDDVKVASITAVEAEEETDEEVEG